MEKPGYFDNLESRIWQARYRKVASGFRLLVFVACIVHCFLYPPFYSPAVIFSLIPISIYVVLTSIYFFGRSSVLGIYALVATDMALGALLIFLTGGLVSPFLLFTLIPVVIASLHIDVRLAMAIALITGAYVIAGHLTSPFFRTDVSNQGIGYMVVYFMTPVLIVSISTLTNINIRVRRRRGYVLMERQRLSREIHDGIAQIIRSLRWRIQMLDVELESRGIHLDEIQEILKLADTAMQETRESLELLRKFTGDGSLLPHLKSYLEHLRQVSKIEYQLDAADDIPDLQKVEELELLRICQEALTNIRKHSRAHNVKVAVNLKGKRLAIRISDDGCGFDSAAIGPNSPFYTGNGLAVMEERAHSLGGKFIVSSCPGQGTEIRVEVPVEGNGRARL